MKKIAIFSMKVITNQMQNMIYRYFKVRNRILKIHCIMHNTRKLVSISINSNTQLVKERDKIKNNKKRELHQV